MALNVLNHLTLSGPALPEPFVRHELEKELNRLKLLPKNTGEEGKDLQASWAAYRRRLRELVARGGALRVHNHVLEPLLERLGYERWEDASAVTTREGLEDGGKLMVARDGVRLRTWAISFAEDLDAPARRGRAYRFSHVRIAQRVLLATGERVGLITNGLELRILLSDPARPDSQLILAIDPYWKRERDLPDSYRLLLALTSPQGTAALPDLVEKARQQQTRVTKDLRTQARQAVQLFIQEIIDHPENQERLASLPNKDALARQLWREGLITVYRLLFTFKLESSDDAAQAFTFAGTSLWRNSFSPSVALAPFARQILDNGAETGHLLEDGVRALFRMFAQGLQSTELNVKPLGGTLFGPNATPLLSQLRWGERAVAHLLDQLLWTGARRGSNARERVHYGPLDVEDLGRVYEALLELEPGIAAEPMCRLRRSKLEVVVPLAQGEPYRPAHLSTDNGTGDDTDEAAEESEDEDGEEEENDNRRGKTIVEWVEAIPTGRFYLRVGLGRKASGSFYTPHSFVRFLVQETLGPLVAERSPQDDPQPGELLKLKVLDDAMGSGHFLVEADRFLGEKLYEACRLCDELASAAEEDAARARNEAEREQALVRAATLRQRVQDLPDPDDALLSYLPSRAPEGEASGISQQKALALCKRLVAVHCLYGVDKNPLAVELAKLALWLECHAEGMPLTFLDHRLVVGDALTGPFFHHLLTYPSSQQSLEGLYSQDLSERFRACLQEALAQVQALEASVGVSVSEMAEKDAAKTRLDRALAPFRVVAAAWAGGVMLGTEASDDPSYKWLVEGVAESGDLPSHLEGREALAAMIARGLGVESVPQDREGLLALLASGQSIPALPFDMTFPEVFFPDGNLDLRGGFHVLLGNPPWDAVQPAAKEFFAAFDLRILDAPTRRERKQIETLVLSDSRTEAIYAKYTSSFTETKLAIDRLYNYVGLTSQGQSSGAVTDLWQVFAERGLSLLQQQGFIGLILPSAFHANQSATGIRTLYLSAAAIQCCFSFENRRKLFDIHLSFKYAAVVAKRAPEGTTSFKCAFYLQDSDWLFKNYKSLCYTLNFIKRTGSEYLSFLELRHEADVSVVDRIFDGSRTTKLWMNTVGIHCGEEAHMSKSSRLFTPVSEVFSESIDPRTAHITGYYPLFEGKVFHQYDDRWGERPRYMVKLVDISDKPTWLTASSFYRLAFRDIASSTNERTGIFCLLPPGVICGNTSPCERYPGLRVYKDVLVFLAVANSYIFDWIIRQKAASHVNAFILGSIPARYFSLDQDSFLAHNSLRLSCNHEGYYPLWKEQLGNVWREAAPSFTWPVLAGDAARWAVRAAIDAVVAQAYGLNREQYAHVLSTFSHASFPKAPQLCLARFDELQQIGLEAFTRKYDPYWDIPLNEELPKPVIDLPIPQAETEGGQLELGI